MNHHQAQILLAERQRHETSHVLHLLLSVVTVGIWIPVWVLVAVSNTIERGKINRKIAELS